MIGIFIIENTIFVSKIEKMIQHKCKFGENSHPSINEIESFHQFDTNGHDLTDCTMQDVDFTKEKINWDIYHFKNTTFLGCNLTLEDQLTILKKGGIIFPKADHLPYNPFRKAMYTWQELMNPIDDHGDSDYHIYKHFEKKKFTPSVNEALYQRIHDHAMDDALRNYLKFDKDGMPSKKCIGIMGGHSAKRSDKFFYKTALTAKILTENGYFIISGGGPGIMEAANLGAYMAGKSIKDLKDAILMLSEESDFNKPKYLDLARAVIDKYPSTSESMAIPTWFYGHEPSNLFGTHIAKYFSNSIREDTLLAISMHGIVFAPGSAGTTQEIFMDATQNHYGTFNYYSPMVFLGKDRYQKETKLFPLLKSLAKGKEYEDLLYLTDSPYHVLRFLEGHAPVGIVL